MQNFVSFEWDEAKRLKNIEKHKIDFLEVTARTFKMYTYTVPIERADYGEQRFLTLGLLNDIEIAVVHTPRGNNTRIISARRARIKERKKYHEEALKMGTDYEALRAMKDEDIDCSDIPELTDEELEGGESLWTGPNTHYTHIALDDEVLNYFRQLGDNYSMRLSSLVNAFLKYYVSQKKIRA